LNHAATVRSTISSSRVPSKPADARFPTAAAPVIPRSPGMTMSTPAADARSGAADANQSVTTNPRNPSPPTEELPFRCPAMMVADSHA